ncbi:putative membrane protein [Bacteroides fragilis str. S24L34]|nr:putative membrane protein [Bacteroides fragilis str. S24L34]
MFDINRALHRLLITAFVLVSYNLASSFFSVSDNFICLMTLE